MIFVMFDKEVMTHMTFSSHAIDKEFHIINNSFTKNTDELPVGVIDVSIARF